MTQSERQLLLAVKLLAEAVDTLARQVGVHPAVFDAVRPKLDQVDALYALAVGLPSEQTVTRL